MPASCTEDACTARFWWLPVSRDRLARGLLSKIALAALEVRFLELER
jgi:hypothetical protein